MFFYRIIFNIKIHRGKASDERFDDILKTSCAEISCYS